jgi:hypothetical protein
VPFSQFAEKNVIVCFEAKCSFLVGGGGSCDNIKQPNYVCFAFLRITLNIL